MMKKWLESSQKPGEVSQTIRGAVMAGSAIIVFIGTQVFGLQLGADDVATLATGLGMIGGGIYAVSGLVMKIVMRMGKE